ncbi:MAG: dihydroxyacetone kinase subunit DhaL, partial [Verrucomicrobiota bacterium]
MSETLNIDDFRKIIASIRDTINENSDFLCELDSHVGDGDHGTTIARGTRAAAEEVESVNPDSISQLLTKAGMAMMKSMGGASGPIFGSLFRGMGKQAEGKDEVNLADLHAMLEAGLKKVMDLGKAEPGEKTLVDSLHPAVEALDTARADGASLADGLTAMVEAAEAGVEKTKEMVAGKGRARYSGERALGH